MADLRDDIYLPVSIWLQSRVAEFVPTRFYKREFANVLDMCCH